MDETRTQETAPGIEEDIREAAECMKRGGIILYPTDTVWGIGCDATNAGAVQKIYKLKQRDERKSMLALVDGEAMLDRYVRDVPEVAWQLTEAAVEPLTVIYDHPEGVASNLVAEDGSLGVRISQERYSSGLCRRLRRPVVSTSANVSGTPAPRTYSEIPDCIKEGVDYVAFYRRDDNTPARPSNIIKVSDGGVVKIIR